MLMSAISCIDDRYAGAGSCYHGSTLLWMTHRTDICVAGNDADGIRNAFARNAAILAVQGVWQTQGAGRLGDRDRRKSTGI